MFEEQYAKVKKHIDSLRGKRGKLRHQRDQEAAKLTKRRRHLGKRVAAGEAVDQLTTEIMQAEARIQALQAAEDAVAQQEQEAEKARQALEQKALEAEAVRLRNDACEAIFRINNVLLPQLQAMDTKLAIAGRRLRGVSSRLKEPGSAPPYHGQLLAIKSMRSTIRRFRKSFGGVYNVGGLATYYRWWLENVASKKEKES